MHSTVNIFKAVQQHCFLFTFTIIILSAPTTDPYPATLFLSVPTAQYHSKPKHCN